MFWSLVRPDRILPPITRSAAVATSLEADESAVGMITCESAQTPEFGRQINWGVAPFQTHTRGGALANRETFQRGGGGDGRKFSTPPNPTAAAPQVFNGLLITRMFEGEWQAFGGGGPGRP